MGEPEAKEDEVVGLIWRPVEEVGLDEAHPLHANTGLGTSQHFRRRVNGGDTGRRAEQELGPRPWAAGEFEHMACRPIGVERRSQSARGLDVYLVLHRNGAVVGDLLGKQGVNRF